MKNSVWGFFLLTSLATSFVTFFATSFSQAQVVSQSINCKISDSFSVSASYSESTQTIHVIKTENGETADFKGISFEQFDKIHLNKNSSILKLAQDAGIDATLANSASFFVLQKSDTSVSELVEFVNVDGESLGVAAMIGPKTQKCL